MGKDEATASGENQGLMDIRIPAGWTLAGLVGGLALGMLLAGTPAYDAVAAVAAPVGTLWLNALQMTIIPLVAALLVVGVVEMTLAAQGGKAARRTVSWIFGLLVLSAVLGALLMPLILKAFPIPPGAQALLMRGPAEAAGEVPGIGAFLVSLVAPNVVAAAGQSAMLPLTIFFCLFALAITRLPTTQREVLTKFFRALGNAMLVLVGWVLGAAPVGVFALAIGVAGAEGGAAFATLGHYILTVAILGVVVMLIAYAIAVLFGRQRLGRFARAIIPAQAVALSTQSSLASLPAMLASARRLGVRDRTADFVLPLAVAMLRSTGPAMNVAVAIYVGTLAGVDIGPMALIAACLVAPLISLGSVSLPGAISFVISIGPIALAMGVPVAPLALLVAVEMFPDIMRTIGNVTMDVAVTTAVDRSVDGDAEETLQP